MIQGQIRLPLRVAVDVVLQGIRIRFGRSLVTISGVVLGVAFVMSNLTSQAVKRGVQDEEQLRTEVGRMANFLAAEMGPPQGRTIGVVQVGPLNVIEKRLAEHLVEHGLERFAWHCTSEDMAPPRFAQDRLTLAALDEVGADASSVLVVGAGAIPKSLAGPEGVSVLLEGARGRVLAVTRADLLPDGGANVSVAQLARTFRPEELEQVEAEKKQAQFRTLWIVIISVVVTAVGITNAMLMSVTERFREIGTMKCLGALSAFVRQIFFVESSLMGIVGGLSGSLLGACFTIAMYGFIYGFGLVLGSLNYGLLSVFLVASVFGGVILSVIAAIYPARVASRMVPADALRSNI